MAKATLKERIQKSIRSKSGSAFRRFVDGPVRTTDAVRRTVRQDSVDVDARTLTAVAATGNSRILDVYDDDLKTWLQVEEVIDIAGMDFSRVESGMHFLDTHRTDDRIYNLGSVESARIEEVDGATAVVVDVKISARTELDSLLVDLAGGQLGCISCQYTADETTLDLREGKLPPLTVVRSTLLEVSLVSVPADPGAMVRSQFSLKGKDMAPKPNKRAEEGALDEAAIVEIVKAALEEATQPAYAFCMTGRQR
jgi:phage head maturation protease